MMAPQDFLVKQDNKNISKILKIFSEINLNTCKDSTLILGYHEA